MSDAIDHAAPGFDDLLSKLVGGDKPTGLDSNALLLMMMQQGQQQSQMMMQMMIAMINANAGKPAIDPTLLAILTKQGDNSQFAALLDMSSKQSAALMEQTRNSLLSVMETKDALHKKTLEEALERAPGEGGGAKSHVAEIMREVRLGLGMLATAPAPVAPALTGSGGPAAAIPQTGAKPAVAQNPAPANLNQPRDSVPVLVLRNLMDLRAGKVKAKPGVFYSALAASCASDDGLVEAMRGGVDEVFAYCAPHVTQHADIMAWLQAPSADAATKSNADWVNGVIEEYIGPLTLTAVDGALEDDEDGDDDGDEGDEDVDPAAPLPDLDDGEDEDDLDDVPLTIPAEPQTLTPADAAAFIPPRVQPKVPVLSAALTNHSPASRTG